MLSINGTVLIIFLSFLLFMLVMRAIFFEPITAIKKQREQSIGSASQAAREAHTKQIEMDKEYRIKLDEARRKAHELIQQKREEAKANASETVNGARSQAQAKVEAETRELAESREQVYQSLTDEKDAFARLIVEKLQNRQAAEASV